ncbi:uncharacterized protein LOC108093855 [Drosophila ficusphila]|uniref:uncharacterized protein LOC108093855 n=1 Tax=Drosophila ficusphila TaxID=30025 RepID=UPI0007E8668A|nr:uncharacterized protein LOC108093855 [Drosophila ficusphila]
MRLNVVSLVLLYVMRSASLRPNSFVMFEKIKMEALDNVLNHFNKKFTFLETQIFGERNRNNNIPKKDNMKGSQFLDTLVKLCESERGNSTNPGLDLTVRAESIKNINNIKNNIQLPEIKIPPITVFILKNAMRAASHNTILLEPSHLKPPSRTMDAQRKGLATDVNRCVLMKIKELNVIRP